MQLRPYQQKAKNDIETFILDDKGHGIVVMPTGAGKSLQIADTALFLHSMGKRVVILADRSKLLQQNYAKLPPEITGIVSAGLGQKDYAKSIVVAGIQTIYNKTSELGYVDFILADECHGIGNDTEADTMYWQFIRNCPFARVLGFTATAHRLNEGLLSWGKIIHETTYQELWESGFLTRLTNKSPYTPDLSSIGKRNGDYAVEELAELYTDDIIKTSCQDLYNRTLDRKKGIVFSPTIKHAIEVCSTLNHLGMNTTLVYAKQSERERQEIYDRFERMDSGLKCLVNVELLSKGCDFTCVDFIALFRSTLSLAWHEQSIGRSVRLFPGKLDSLICDYAGNLKEHGTLGSPIWKYFGSKKMRKNSNVLRICPNCEGSVNISLQFCDQCGYKFLISEKEASEHNTAADDWTDMDKPKDPKKWYSPNMVLYNKHESKASGNLSLRVSYMCGRAEFSEYIPIGNPAWWAQKKVKEFCTRLGVPIPASIDSALESCQYWKKPKSIQIEPQKGNPKYFNVIGYVW